ncbi:hypothetical protein DRE_00927 [Drechslerella stenobrocha 248]|uniref:F-box domain-containing protein n=1 Tax=Drechslerella stenobrocha 248 TaxID=1043628 RepID=W7HY54_9PEZI|nr:hypothetical protein DRE_00927 [Drechslerella stenobrocha 248]
MTMSTPPILRLPFELHEKIACYLSGAQDTVALSNTCRILRDRLQASNYIWYRLLYLAGSVQNEYDKYNPKLDYYKRAQRVRSRKRLRCQICLSVGPVVTVDVQNVFYGVYCDGCLNQRFYDLATFQHVYDAYWEGIICPPQLQAPKFLIAKGYTQLVAKSCPMGRVPRRNTPISLVLRSDATRILKAFMESEEAVEDCWATIKARNEQLAATEHQDPQQTVEDVLDVMVEDYEDHYQGLHTEKSPREFREQWRHKVGSVLSRPKSGGLPVAAHSTTSTVTLRSPVAAGASKGAQLLHRLSAPSAPKLMSET